MGIDTPREPHEGAQQDKITRPDVPENIDTAGEPIYDLRDVGVESAEVSEVAKDADRAVEELSADVEQMIQEPGEHTPEELGGILGKVREVIDRGKSWLNLRQRAMSASEGEEAQSTEATTLVFTDAEKEKAALEHAELKQPAGQSDSRAAFEQAGQNIRFAAVAEQAGLKTGEIKTGVIQLSDQEKINAAADRIRQGFPSFYKGIEVKTLEELDQMAKQESTEDAQAAK